MRIKIGDSAASTRRAPSSTRRMPGIYSWRAILWVSELIDQTSDFVDQTSDFVDETSVILFMDHFLGKARTSADCLSADFAASKVEAFARF